MSKRKIFNDPVHGFISIPHELILDIIDHPYFQRLRQIKQMGLTEYVYPGAINTRFNHALGAMHLMQLAIKTLRLKQHEITEEEELGCLLAILLHDIGHGPYSHTLEHCLSKDIKHEELSLLFMEALNLEFKGQLTTAIKIFKGEHPKRFLHQLVSSQLDMDRLDYLARDSYFTGVSEGIISYSRIIDMLDVVDNEIVVEAKGIYSIEKYLIARRLMYWQVYLHKTVIVVEDLLIKVMERAKMYAWESAKMVCSEALKHFLVNEVTMANFRQDPGLLDQYASLDDHDVYSAIKSWCHHPDKVISMLCKAIVARRLFRIELTKQPFREEYVQSIIDKTKKALDLNDEEAGFIVFQDVTSNSTYSRNESEAIKILFKDGTITDMKEASEQLDIALLKEPVMKYYLVYPKGIT